MANEMQKQREARPNVVVVPLSEHFRWLQVRAFAVHLYTASSAVLAFLIVLSAFQRNIALALWLGLAAVIIDGTDGWLARRFHVKEVLPWFDGRRLDDIVDYLIYVFAPMLLLWSTHNLPTGAMGIILAALPLLASGYQFCRVDAKTEDYFFLGFPSYWNIVAYYVIIFNLPLAAVTAILLSCTILVFIPIRYLYPSRTIEFRRLTLLLTGLWLLDYALILLQLPHPNAILLYFLLFYMLYYVVLSLYLAYRRRLRLKAGT
jgi:phosphatidylcholine synthase